MTLTPAEKSSPLWRALLEHWGVRLESLRVQLEGQRSEYETAVIRGQIKQLRSDLRLNEEVPAAPE